MDSWVDWGIGGTLILLLLGAGVYVGIQYEKRQWQAHIPEQMSLLCVECKQIGEDQVLNSVLQRMEPNP